MRGLHQRSRSNQTSARPVSWAARWGMALAVLAGGAAILSGLGTRFHWWHFGVGFTILRAAAYAGLAAAAVSAFGLLRGRPGGPRRGMVRAMVGLVVGLLVVWVPWSWRETARDVPAIHDISTDLEHPPAFEAILPLRRAAPNPSTYGGEAVAAQQRRAYPDIQPLVTEASPERVFDQALHTARELGWKIVNADRSHGLIEATDTTLWFGFKDDVVIRVTSRTRGSLVDVRSVSRVGRSDVGTNAQRIRRYLENLNARLGAGRSTSNTPS